MNFIAPLILAGAVVIGVGQSAPQPSRTQDRAVGTIKASERPAVARVSTPKSFTVPGGNNYVLRKGGLPGQSASFDKLTTGQVLGDTHCVQINCPPGMEPGTVCWRCYEILAPDAE